MGAYVLGIGVLLGFYYARLPDRDIPEYVDWALIESEFGEVMDSLTGTREIESLEAAEHERDRLRAVIEADPIFWSIQFPDERFDRGTRGNFFQRQARSSGSCTGQPGDHHGLMRCTREVEGSRNRQTLRFVRRPLHEDSLRSVFEIEFDFEVFLDRYPGHVDYAPDAPTLQQQDQQLLGSWRLERRSSRGDKGPRREVVSLSVGPRLSPGKYAVQASVEMVPLDHSGPATDCTQPGDRCKWFGKSAGTLRIRGSRVQILYEERRWFSDRLQQTSEGLLGTDPWGDPVRFQRKE
ncbi:MAG: hypothetical protein JJT88_11715 [Gammaproteobacteria bacterium]|nr:hypothetical protein [Gammaproteobacteria bacterium]